MSDLSTTEQDDAFGLGILFLDCLPATLSISPGFQLLSIVASKSRVQPRVCAAHGKRPINAEFHTLADFQKGAAAFRTALMRNRGVERVYVQSAFRVRLSSLDLVQKSIVFLNNGALKSALAPAQGIAVIPTYCGRKMLISVFFDEFNHILDGHRNLLTDDATAAIESSPRYEFEPLLGLGLNLRPPLL
jgi:hypothetical protein